MQPQSCVPIPMSQTMMNSCAWLVGPIGHEDHDRQSPGSHPDIEGSDCEGV